MLTAWVASTVDRMAWTTLIRPSLRRTTANSAASVAPVHLFVHSRPAHAAIILVHGYLGGHALIEERAWPVKRWFARGFDVALFTLPYHGARPRNPRLCLTSHGIEDAIDNLRALLRQLRARGTSRIAVMGMSLGGFLVSKLATIEPKLELVVPMIPLSDLRDFAGVAVEGPLQRSPLVRGDRMLVIGARHDRIAPLAHAQALAAHFSAPLTIMSGGHLIQLGRAAAFAEVDELLARRLA